MMISKNQKKSKKTKNRKNPTGSLLFHFDIITAIRTLLDTLTTIRKKIDPTDGKNDKNNSIKLKKIEKSLEQIKKKLSSLVDQVSHKLEKE